jgi:hypothetical protein
MKVKNERRVGLVGFFLLTCLVLSPPRTLSVVAQSTGHINDLLSEERIEAKPLPHLKGTALLDLPENILAIQHKQIEDYFLGAIAKTPELRDKRWTPDYSSDGAYKDSVQKHRASLRSLLGLPEIGPVKELTRKEVNSAGPRIEDIVLESADGLQSRAMLFFANDSARAGVVAVPDSRQTREDFAGLTRGEAPDWLKELLERHAVVCVPITILRALDHPLSEKLRGKDRRHILHRLGFVVGRTTVGLEVAQAVTLGRYLRERFSLDATWILGEGQGGMTSLYAAAVDEEFAGAVVVDYFQKREGAWKEPVDRLLHGQLEEFGDAELAALIAPRPLVIATTPSGPLKHSVEGEVQRAQRFYGGLKMNDRLRVIEGAGLKASVAQLIEQTGWKAGQEQTIAFQPVGKDRVNRADDEHFEALHSYLRRLIDASDDHRKKRWALLDTPPVDRARKADELREELRQLLGDIKPAPIALNPRTKLIQLTSDFAAYEVLLDVLPGLEAYGQLLIPRGAKKDLPAVICQHGLGGAPKYATGLASGQDTVYHQFGSELARRGYVVFAPYVDVPIPQEELVNRVVRQAASLGQMRTSIELVKLRRIVDFLQSLPEVEADKIGYYGLSYGGYSATWMPPLEPRLQLTIISGHFNDWKTKITNEEERTSYLLHPDEDFYNWNVLNRFTHGELVAAMWPRPVCVEFANRDTTTSPEWANRAWAGVAQWARAWDSEDKYVRDHFDGVHEIHGIGTFDFLNRWLRPELLPGRDYDYNLKPIKTDLPGIGDPSEDIGPYVATSLDSSRENVVRGDFYVTKEASQFHGIRIRVSRVGQPGDLVVSFGSEAGKDDLGQSRIGSGAIHPLYDLAYEVRIEPQELEPLRKYHFEIRAEDAWIRQDNYYRIYGPKPLGGRDYLPRFALSYQVLAQGQGQPGERAAGESRFEFMRGYLDPYVSGESFQSADRRPAGAVKLTPGWRITFDEGADEVVRTAATDLKEFFGNALGLEIGLGAKPGKPQVSLQVGSKVDGVASSEGYRIEIGADRINISGTTSRGVMRGVYWLEEMFRLRGGPGLAPEVIVRNQRFSPRITMPVLAGAAKYTETSRPLTYTDGLLSRISHDGFNALWLWLNVEEATMNSEIFPDFNSADAPARYSRLKDLTIRAERYGIDVYLYLATGYHHHIPDRFYDRHPDLRGYGWGKPLCTSQEIVRDYYSETVNTIFSRVPKVKGLIVIYDSEGFFYCGSHEQTRLQCPRCRHQSRPYLANQLLRTLKDAVEQAGGADKELIAWNYDKESDWVLELLPMLPKDLIVQSNFGKGSIVERDGIEHKTGDYNITSIGPPDLFERMHRVAAEQQLRLMAKTEHAISQEAIFVPYIPALEQWYRRIARIREYEVHGWFGNWSHYGWTPSRPARLINHMSFDPAPSLEEMLKLLAQRDFGEQAVPHVLKAWHHFSEGIRVFPYSDAVARIPGPLQKGPSHPFFLDPKVESFGQWRSWQNDLQWAKPWGVKTTEKYLKLVAQHFDDGVRELDAAMQKATERDCDALRGEWQIGRTIQSSLHTILNLITWIEARDSYVAATDRQERSALRARLRSIAETEYQNAKDIVPLLARDSRLGYASEGGGIVRGGLFSTQLVRWKVGQLEDLLVRELPELEMGETR